MEIREIKDKNEWKEALGSGLGVHFAQSFAWGEIYVREGKRVGRLVVEDNGRQILGVQVLYQSLFFGWNYAFCPKGAVGGGEEALKTLVSYLSRRGCIFFRIEPPQVLVNSKFLIKKTIDVNPRATTVLDLTKSEEQLLAKMHPKTRYNIRLAEKKGLVIKEEKNPDELLRLMKMTGERDKFRLHSDKHYIEVLNSEIVRQINVESGGETIAVGVFVGYGDTFTYLYGASDHNFRSFMAPYLVQWEGIKLGKKLGFTKYDFFGIAPKVEEVGGEYSYDPKHQYAGVTRFKLGFGGEIKEEPGTYDLIINKNKYSFYQLLRIIRRLC